MKKIIWVLLISFVSTADAATYYVSQSTGKDTNTGLSHAQAWKTIAKVNGVTFATGDDVYFMAGDTWSGTQLQIDWAGTSGNRAIVGSYYMSGSETVGVPDGVNKPTIYGGFVPNSGDIGNVPSGPYGALVAILGAYVTLENLRVENSSGFGIANQEGFENNIIQDNEVIHSVGSSIATWNYSHYIIVRNNYLYQSVWARAEGINDQAYGGSTHPPCLRIRNSDYALVENNTLVEGKCEGIDLVKNSDYGIVRANKIYNTSAVGLYIDKGSNNVLEHNLIVHDASKSYGGIASVLEGPNYGPNHDNIIRNNVVINAQHCITTDVWPTAVAAGMTISGQIIGNICINTDTGIRIQETAASYANGLEIANNIIWGPPDVGTVCYSPTTANIDFHNNSWGFNPSDSDCDGSGDVYGDPTFTYTGDWAALDSSNPPTTTDFTPQSGSNTEDAGADLDTVIISTGDYPQYTSITNPCSTFDTTELGYDYTCDARNATTPDIGAIEIGGAPILPSDVSLPFYMNIGGNTIGPLASGRSYEAEQYRSADGVNLSYTNSNTTAIDATTDDLLYQTWRGKNGTMSWSIPIANGNYDLTLLYQEQYWGFSEGSCTTAGSSRQFDVSVEGVLVRDEFDICKLAGAPFTAVRDVIPNITVTDGQLNIILSLGQGQDPKPQLMGLEITVAAPVPSPPGNLIVR